MMEGTALDVMLEIFLVTKMVETVVDMKRAILSLQVRVFVVVPII